MSGSLPANHKEASLQKNPLHLGDIGPSLVTKQDARPHLSAHLSPIETLFFAGAGRTAHKWLHYLRVYDTLFAAYRGHAIMLEIGVGQGGSLDLWRSYFGPDAVLFGIDTDPECLRRVSPPNHVRIGSQADGQFLASVVAEMGRPNIILDDGSHIGAHQIASFRALFPLLQDGGLYVIEDLHTSYWSAYQGGKGVACTAVGLIKALIDDQHACYHPEAETYSPHAAIESIQIFDSIAAIKKGNRTPPVHCMSGGGV
jgi:hypothetical protein